MQGHPKAWWACSVIVIQFPPARLAQSDLSLSPVRACRMWAVQVDYGSNSDVRPSAALDGEAFHTRLQQLGGTQLPSGAIASETRNHVTKR